MDERTLIVFLAGLLYVLWLAAGLVDYLCHRWTDIAGTSGAPESWFHLWQFVVLGLALLFGTLLVITPLAFALIVACVCAHSVLAFRDVSYTQGRRFISPLEQLAHGHMEVVPIVAVGLLAILNWDDLTGAEWILQWKSPALSAMTLAMWLGSFFLLAVAPILEELLRTSTKNRGADTAPERPANLRDA
jgi:hypothetical protein